MKAAVRLPVLKKGSPAVRVCRPSDDARSVVEMSSDRRSTELPLGARMKATLAGFSFGRRDEAERRTVVGTYGSEAETTRAASSCSSNAKILGATTAGRVRVAAAAEGEPGRRPVGGANTASISLVGE